MLPRDQRFDLKAPAALVFGRGTVTQVGPRASEVGETAMVVTDSGIVEAGLLDPVKTALTEAGLEVALFDEVEPDPPASIAVACADAARTAGADVIVGLGGGSSMDVAKAAAAIVGTSRDIRDLYGRGNVGGETLPKIQIPTTAGTGAEVSQSCVLFDDLGAGGKQGIVDDTLFATAAIVDPDLSMDLPPAITATTGVDAFAHAIGSFCSTTTNGLADALCGEAMARIEANLRDAYYHGAEASTAREEMALAATMAMLGRINGGKAAIHAIAYGIQAHYDVPHGQAIAMVLPEVVEYNLPACTEPLANLGERLYAATGSRRDRAITVVEELAVLRADLGLDRTLPEVGGDRSELDELAEAGVESTRHLEANPRAMTPSDAREIYERLFPAA